MSRSAAGTYSLPVGQPVVTGTTISASTFNTLTSDLSTEMTDSWSRSGKGAALAPLALYDSASSTVPDLAWSGDTNTGIGHSAADTLNLIAGGGTVAALTTAGIAVTGVLSATGVTSLANGAVGTPGLNFTSDTDCGLYRIGANDIAISVGGVKQFELTTAAATIVQNTTVSGTLTSTGAFVGSSTANIVGNFSVATNKFTVAAASGNTVVAGTLNVTAQAVVGGSLSAVGLTSTAGAVISNTSATVLTVTAATQGIGLLVTGAGTATAISATGGATAGAIGIAASAGAGGGHAVELTPVAPYASFNIGVATATPTVLSNGDMWIENVGGTWHFKIRMNGATSTIV